MNKTLQHLLIAFAFALIPLPGFAQNASNGGDYVALQVPDLHQAVTFFHDVMNCNSLTGGDNASINSVALLDCGRQMVVELTQVAHAPGQPKSNLPLDTFTLDTDDPTNVATRLRANHVSLVGKPVRIIHGEDRGKVAVSFITPWGQPLKLVSRLRPGDSFPDTAAPAAAVAEQ